MGAFSYENQGTNTYLVYSVAQDEKLDTVSLGMLTNNRIAGFAPTLFTQVDADKFIKYNVTAKVSANQFFAGTVNKKRLIGVFSGIVNAMISAEEYMINANNIILDLDYIFTDVSSCDTVLICLPVADNDSATQDMGKFFKDIMIDATLDRTENCNYFTEIINFLNSSPVFSLVDFKNLLSDISTGPASPVPPPPVPPPVKKTGIVQPTVTKKNLPPAPPPGIPKQSPTPVQPPPSVKPLQQPQAHNIQSTAAVPNTENKQITLFGLLMNYNKENAALYKAQKAAQKGQAKLQTPQQPKSPTKQPTNQTSFAVPGASSNVGFAIPGQPVPAPTPAPTSAQQPASQQPTPQQQPAAHQPAPQQPVPLQPVSHQPSVPQSRAMNFGETIVLHGGNIGETIVLNESSQSKQAFYPHLIRSKNNEKIMIDKPVYRIGKEKSYVDYFIGDNTTISRSHANILTRDGKYFVVDTNSTNHTYVNGSMIQSNSEVEISHGTKIRLANEDFIFNLY